MSELLRVPALRVTVLGRAEPGGSKSAFTPPHASRPVLVDANPRAAPWKLVVASAVYDAWGEQPLLTGPLEVQHDFYQRRPRSHYRTGRNEHLVRHSAPAFPLVRPDYGKLARPVDDALTGLVWRDDAQIVEARIRKFYGEPERLELRVYTIEVPARLELIEPDQLAIA
jgi:Holliday junction resolvase RusA-like endonuclease